MPNTSYDLISINDVQVPDIGKGAVSVAPNQKYTEYEGEFGNKVLDVINETQIRGTITFNGILQSELQRIFAAVQLSSVMEIYNPFTGMVKRFQAKIIVGESGKIVHDAIANAWSFSFEFEEIDDAEE